MTDDELIKAIQKAVKNEVRPLKDQVEIVKSKINSKDFFQTVASENTRTIKEQQSIMNEKLDTLHEDLKEIKNYKKTESIFQWYILSRQLRLLVMPTKSITTTRVS